MIRTVNLSTDGSRAQAAEDVIQIRKPKRRKFCKYRRRLFDRYFGGSEIHGLTLGFMDDVPPLLRAVWMAVLTLVTALSASTTVTVINEYVEHQTATTFKIKQDARMEMPSLIMCPKNPDALNVSALVADIRRAQPDLVADEDAERLVAFVLADAGFANMDRLLRGVDEERAAVLAARVRHWRRDLPARDFHRHLFAHYGYTCHQFFRFCRHGTNDLPCCDLFEEHYVMLRGRCFRLKRLYQTDVDYRGRFYVGVNQLPAPLTTSRRLQPQVVAYVAQTNLDAVSFPRFYINYHSFNIINCRMRSLRNLRTSETCNGSRDYRGRNDCYIRNWLRVRLIDPLNCTLFYLRDKHAEVPVCETGVVVRNYKSIQNVSSVSHMCLPKCARHEITCSHVFDEDNPHRDFTIFKNEDLPDFQVEIGFSDLEYEQYEEFKTTTLPGFISELGGQFGLFIGVSLTSVIQLALNVSAVCQALHRRWHRRKSQN